MNYLMLVNKKHGLGDGYLPSTLVDVESKYKNGIKLEAITYQHWVALKSFVLLKGYVIDVESGYRSYDYQSKILQEVIAEKGSDYAHKAVAIPGYSEHQTGLALDYCVTRDDTFVIEDEMDNCEECIYTNSIAHLYGFIIRYPKGKDQITGYIYEPWHLRYVGEELATYLYENKITLDEYYEEEKHEKS